MRPCQRLAVFTWIHTALVAVAAVGWALSACWHTAAVEAMSDQLIRDGVVSAEALPSVIEGYPSLGMHLQQGWDAKSLGWGFALCLIALGGSLIIAITASVRALRSLPSPAGSITSPAAPAPPPARPG